MPQRDDPKPSHEGRAGDDLQKIAGIGSTLAQRLWNAGILTYDDLARRNPKEIAAAAGISAERIASQNWTGQARELAGAPPEASVPRQHYATFHVEFLLESDDRVRRTKVHHHQTDARDAWAGWDEEKLLAFLRARVPLPAAGTPADAPVPESAGTQTTDQAAASVPAEPTSQPPPSRRERPPSWSLSIEELAAVRGDQRSYSWGPGEPNSVRLTMRINPAGPLSHDTFDYSATIEARALGGRDRSLLGTSQGTIRISDPLSVKVTGPALPVGQYRLVSIVEIYPAGHSPEEPPLHSQGVSGDLLRVADDPPGSAPAVA
jgi:helix-hairpin-helix protein